MKKTIIVICLVMTVLACHARIGEGSVPKERLISLVNHYNDTDGVEVIQAGTLKTAALKALVSIAAKADGDGRANELIKIINGIKKVAIFDFSDCSEEKAEEINRKLSKMLGPAELLMEAKDDDGDAMRMYGILNDSDSSIRDFVMYSPGERTLICFFGKISRIDSLR